MRDLWVDPFSGLSGDLWVGAFLALGVPEAELQAVLRRLPFPDLGLRVETVLRCGVQATKASVILGGQVDTGATPHLAEGPLKAVRKRVRVGGHDHVHGLSWREVDELLARHLDPQVAGYAREAFRRLGESEARVHGMPLDQVHFHEVGVKDSIADVALAAAGFVLLGEPKVHLGPIATGKGTWKMAHGQYPIPGPATTYLLTGFELKEGVAPVDHFPTTPNVLRLQLGTVPEGAAELLQLETNVDDATPQQVAHAQARLMEAGALDAWVTAATFKKGRSGWVVGVILEPAKLEALSQILVAELPTLGLRCWPLQRLEAERSFRPSAVEGVDLKEGRWPNATVQQPEYDHAVKAAKATGTSLRAVQAKAKGK